MSTVANLVVKVSANTGDFDKQIATLERGFDRAGAKMQSIGAKLTAGVSIPLVAAGAALVKIGTDFDNAADSIRAATGATGQQLDSLNASMKAVFASVPASMSDVASVIGDLNVRTGQTGASLETMAAQMLNLSRLTGSDVAPLVAATTRLFGDWSIATGNQAAALDFLFKTSQATGIGVTRLSELVVQFGAPMRALGFEFEQAAALMGKWEKEGVNLETVLAGLRFALGNFAKAGLEPEAALKGVIEKIQSAKTESEATGIAFQVFGKRAAVDMSRAIVEGRFNIDNLVTSLKNSKETINTAAMATLSLGERMQLLGNRIMVAAEPLATRFVVGLEKLLVAGMPLIDMLARIGTWFANLPQPIQTGAIALVGFAAALGPVVYIAGTVSQAIGGLLAVFRTIGAAGIAGSLIPAFNGARMVVTGFGAALLGLPFVGVIAGISGIAAALGLLVPQIRGAIREMGVMGTVSQGFWGAILASPFGAALAPTGGAGTRRAAAGAGRPGEGFKGKDINLGVETTPADLIKSAMGSADISKLMKVDDAAKKAAEAAKRLAEEWKKVNDEITGKAALSAASDWMKRLEQIGGVSSLTAKATADLTRALEEAFEVLGYAPVQMLDAYVASLARGLNLMTQKGLGNLNAGAMLPGAQDMSDFRHAAIFGMGGSIGNVTSGLDNIAGMLPGRVDPESLARPYIGPLRSAFTDFFQNELPNIISQGLRSGNLGAALVQGLAGTLAQHTQAAINAAGGDPRNLSGGQKILAYGSLALNAGLSGYQMGQQHGKGKGALGGALSGALGGMAFGPLGMGIGAIAGGIGGLIGGLGNRGRDLVEQFAMMHGGFDKLHQKLLDMGPAGEALWVALTQGSGRNNPEEAAKAIEAVSSALGDFPETKLQAISDLMAGVNARAQNLTGQGDLDVVSAGAMAGFSLAVQNGASAIEAFQGISGAVTAMRDSMASNNLTMTESALRLFELGGYLDANAIQFQNIAATGQIMSAMMKGNITDASLMSAVALDLGNQLQTIINNGVPMAQALALSQPQLQSLWEAQQRFGFATDATTQSLLDQAVQQGIVGASMKDVNQKILDVLILIGDQLGAQIPDALRGLPAVAAESAAGMQGAFDGLNLRVGAEIDWHGEVPDLRGYKDQPTAGEEYDVPQLARGGIVMARAGGTLVNVGEGGRDEAVIPLGSSRMSGGVGSTIIQFEQDGLRSAEFIVPHIPDVVHRFGLI